eukprot:jgi/Mesen1/11016/ME000098S10406
MSGQRASRSVFVGNIPYDATEEQLLQICEEVGPVVSFRLVLDRETGKPKGYGFCEYKDEETAQSARRNLQGYDINGRQLRVDFAENEKGSGQDKSAAKANGPPPPGSYIYGASLTSPSHTLGWAALGPLTAQPPPPHFRGSHFQPHPQAQPQPQPQPQQAPMGLAAAAAAASAVAGALTPPGQPPPDGGAAAGGSDALTNQLAGMSRQQLYDLLAQMKVLIQTNHSQARSVLIANPQLARGLFQAQVMLGMVKPLAPGAALQAPAAPGAGAPPAQVHAPRYPAPPAGMRCSRHVLTLSPLPPTFCR